MKKYISILLIILLFTSGCAKKPLPAVVNSLPVPSAKTATPLETKASSKVASADDNLSTPNPTSAARKTESPAVTPKADTNNNTGKILATNVPPLQTEKPKPTDAPVILKEVSISAVDNEGVSILPSSKVSYSDDMTVFDALKTASAQSGVKYDSKGIGSYVYIQGIGDLYEFDRGARSGWVYSVNGSQPGKSAGSTKLKSGDVVLWRYTVTGN